MSADSQASVQLGMLSFHVNRLIPAVAAMLGVAAWVLPLVAPWFLLLPIVIGLVGLLSPPQHRAGRLIWGIGSAGVIGLIACGGLSAPIGAAAMSATLLCLIDRKLRAHCAAILLLQTSTALSIQCSLGDLLSEWGLEAAAPGIIAATAIGFLTLSPGLFTVAALATLLCAAATSWLVLSPALSLAISALPVLVSVGCAATGRDRKETPAVTMLAVACVALTWFWTPPRMLGETWVMLPEDSSAYESQYFQNYQSVLRFVGLPARATTSLESIPDGATVLLPWLTADLPIDLSEVRDRARERGWTILVAGEHTRYGAVDQRLAELTGSNILHDDLTVPRFNANVSGQLRGGGLSGWPPTAVLNRGASVKVEGLRSRTLLAADGWWAEPDLNEWLWAGDYVYRADDRGGRIALATSYDDGLARWIVFGDNSFLVNEQLIADPRPLSGALSEATLWPMLSRDLSLLILITILFAIPKRGGTLTWRLAYLGALLLVTIAPSFITLGFVPSQKWRSVYVGEHAFDERSFAKTLASNSELLDSEWTLLRIEQDLNGNMSLPNEKTIVFALVESELRIGNVTLSECRRLGNLAAEEEVSIRDGQACRVSGEVDVLVGDDRSAAVLELRGGNSRMILVLDKQFLSRSAPPENLSFLLRALEKERSH